MKWFVIRDARIEEQDDVGETDVHILFPTDNLENYPDGLIRVGKAYVGLIYFRTRKWAEVALGDRLRRSLPVVLVEPSDAERAAWPEATRAYVDELERFYDTQKNLIPGNRAEEDRDEFLKTNVHGDPRWGKRE